MFDSPSNNICVVDDCVELTNQVFLVHFEGETIIMPKPGRYEPKSTKHVPVCLIHRVEMINGASFNFNLNKKEGNTMPENNSPIHVCVNLIDADTTAPFLTCEEVKMDCMHHGAIKGDVRVTCGAPTKAGHPCKVPNCGIKTHIAWHGEQADIAQEERDYEFTGLGAEGMEVLQESNEADYREALIRENLPHVEVDSTVHTTDCMGNYNDGGCLGECFFMKCGNSKVHGKGNIFYHFNKEEVKACYGVPAVPVKKSYGPTADELEQAHFGNGKPVGKTNKTYGPTADELEAAHFGPKVEVEKVDCHSCTDGTRVWGTCTNGVWSGMGKCMCCGGKGYMTPADVKRDNAYHNLNG